MRAKNKQKTLKRANSLQDLKKIKRIKEAKKTIKKKRSSSEKNKWFLQRVSVCGELTTAPC